MSQASHPSVPGARRGRAHALALGFTLLLISPTAAAQRPAPAGARRTVAVGVRPESVTRGFGGKLFVTVMNDSKKPGDGVVKVVDGEAVRDFASGFDEPKGLCFNGTFLVLTDVKRLWKIDRHGDKTLLADEKDFPYPPGYLNDVACRRGDQAVYVSDMGANTKARDAQGNLWPMDSAEAKALPAIGRIYRVALDVVSSGPSRGVGGGGSADERVPHVGAVTTVVDSRPDMPCPNGVAHPGGRRLLIAEFFSGNILRVNGLQVTVLPVGLRGADGIEEDRSGDVYVSSWTQGKVWRLGRDGRGTDKSPPVEIAQGFQSAADFFLDEAAKVLIVPDMKAGTLNFVPMPASSRHGR